MLKDDYTPLLSMLQALKTRQASDRPQSLFLPLFEPSGFLFGTLELHAKEQSTGLAKRSDFTPELQARLAQLSSTLQVGLSCLSQHLGMLHQVSTCADLSV